MFNLNDFIGLKEIMEQDAGNKMDWYAQDRRLFISNPQGTSELMLRLLGKEIVIARIEVVNQRSGVGTKILEWLKKYCLLHGLNSIQIEGVYPEGMHAFAQKHGFFVYGEPMGEIKSYRLLLREAPKVIISANID